MIKLFVLIIVIVIFFRLKRYTKNESFCNRKIGGITVVIRSYSRPWNVEKMIKTLLDKDKYPSITEILVSHGNPLTYRDFKEVINIQQFELNKVYGGTQGFFTASESLNEYILLIDDDHIPSPELVKELYINISHEPIGIYGPHKRTCNNNGYFHDKDEYNVILTSSMMTSRTIVKSYIDHFEKYSDTLEETHGNGEDLSFNHHFITYFGKTPVYVAGDITKLDENTGSYKGKPMHYNQRTEFCKKYFKKYPPSC